MNCRQAQEAIEAQFETPEGGMSERDLKSHLQDCPDCRSLWHALSAVEDGLRTVAREREPAVPQTLHAGIMGRLKRAETESRNISRIRALSRWSLAAAALLAAGIVIRGYSLRESAQSVRDREIAMRLLSPPAEIGFVDADVILEYAGADIAALAGTLGVVATSAMGVAGDEGPGESRNNLF